MGWTVRNRGKTQFGREDEKASDDNVSWKDQELKRDEGFPKHDPIEVAHEDTEDGQPMHKVASFVVEEYSHRWNWRRTNCRLASLAERFQVVQEWRITKDRTHSKQTQEGHLRSWVGRNGRDWTRILQAITPPRAHINCQGNTWPHLACPSSWHRVRQSTSPDEVHDRDHGLGGFEVTNIREEEFPEESGQLRRRHIQRIDQLYQTKKVTYSWHNCDANTNRIIA